MATICSDQFVQLAKSVSAAKELPSLPLVIVPHPMGGITPEEVRAKADNAIDRVVQLLTESRNKLVAAQEAG